MAIKNIIFDIDGVLVNLDRSYYNFLKETYPEFQDIRYEDLPALFPMREHDGAIELLGCHGTDYYHSRFFCDRPPFEETIPVLKKLKAQGLRLFTLSASSSPQRKLPWLKELFGDIFEEYEFSPFGIPKDSAIKKLLVKHSLNKEETLFIDDRIFNVRAGLDAGVKVVRKLPDFYLPLPQELSYVVCIRSLGELDNMLAVL